LINRIDFRTTYQRKLLAKECHQFNNKDFSQADIALAKHFKAASPPTLEVLNSRAINSFFNYSTTKSLLLTFSPVGDSQLFVL